MVHDPSGTADTIIIYSSLSHDPFVITILVYIPLAMTAALWYNRTVHGGT